MSSREPARLSSRTAFIVVAAVLGLSLWASGSPAMVYPIYVEEWGATPALTTALFATYPLALVLALTVGGTLSDALGRRSVLLGGMSVVALGTLVFLIAGELPWLFVGRAAQGIGVGIGLSAAAAALTDFNVSARPARASAVNTAATSIGATVAIMAGGALVQFSAAPARAPFALLLVVVIVTLVLLWFLPEHGTVRAPWRPTRPHVPVAGRRPFVLGTGTVLSAFVMGGVFLALGAQIAKELVGSQNAFITSLALASWPLAGVPAAFVANRIRVRTASLIGGAAAAVGSVLLLPAAAHHSFTMFLVSSVVSGFGYGLMFSAGFSLVSAAAPEKQRAGALSTMYLTVYIAQAVGAVAIGVVATSAGLATALTIGMPVIALLCVLAAVCAVPKSK